MYKDVGENVCKARREHSYSYFREKVDQTKVERV